MFYCTYMHTTMLSTTTIEIGDDLIGIDDLRKGLGLLMDISSTAADHTTAVDVEDDPCLLTEEQIQQVC